ncbi:RNA polymerase I-associated factor PAF67 isoform 3 [Hibiscus syriacus]|uniref:RNA polymerase I-associated factor PAF67 isoform 3 n=1 Tax=Hibiscus syriacus TaxID=106335 RepID=A0A6A2YTJ2_HIBSY|nr:RNA polymerase I-associated factor PAF67 isoform 3 [Hibiscus syriacus]
MVGGCVATMSMSILKMIPTSVFWGYFPFKAIESLSGNQFWEQILLLFTAPSRKYKVLEQQHATCNVCGDPLVQGNCNVYHLPNCLSATPKFFIESHLYDLDVAEYEEAPALPYNLATETSWDMEHPMQGTMKYYMKLLHEAEKFEEDQKGKSSGRPNYLQAFVEKSNIIQILEQEKEGGEQFTATDGYGYSGGSNVLKVLGYFSMVGLLRVHCLLGDYQTGLKCLLPIDISQQGVNTSVIEDAYGLHLKLFLYEAKQQQLLSGVRTFLKVYSTISLGKIANYMEVDEPTLRSILFTYKHKTHAVDSDGKIISNADVDFYIDDVGSIPSYGF